MLSYTGLALISGRMIILLKGNVGTEDDIEEGASGNRIRREQPESLFPLLQLLHTLMINEKGLNVREGVITGLEAKALCCIRTLPRIKIQCILQAIISEEYFVLSIFFFFTKFGNRRFKIKLFDKSLDFKYVLLPTEGKPTYVKKKNQ